MTLRLGVIGCGAATRRIHLPGLRASGRFEIVAFTSRTRASAEAAAGDCGAGDVIDDWNDLLTLPELDAVLVATPNALHAEFAIAAAGAGKHVLVEKPMATSVADADAIVAAAERADVVVVPTQTLRCAAPFVAARDTFANGDVGTVVAVRAGFGHAGPEAWAPEATWFLDHALAGGGALIDLGIHLVDLVRFVVRDEITEVAAMADSGPGEVERSATMVGRFGSGGLLTLHASWAVGAGHDLQLTIFGSAGTLHLDAGTPLTLRRPGAGGEPVDLPPAGIDLYAGFADAVEHGGVPPVTVADGRANVATVCAAYESAATGTVVRVS